MCVAPNNNEREIFNTLSFAERRTDAASQATTAERSNDAAAATADGNHQHNKGSYHNLCAQIDEQDKEIRWSESAGKDLET